MTVTVTALNEDALEQRIAEARKAGEEAMRKAEQTINPGLARRWRDKARSHYARMAGLISMRSPERVEQMERERGLR